MSDLTTSKTIADELYHGQTVPWMIKEPGQYYFEKGLVIEQDEEDNSTKTTEIGSWLIGLSVACHEEVETTQLIDIACFIGQMVGSSGKVQILN